MIRVLFVILFFGLRLASFSQNQPVSVEEQKIVLIGLLISKHNLSSDEFCKSYITRNLNPLLNRNSTCRALYYGRDGEKVSVEIDEVYNAYKAYCSSEDVFILLKAANSSSKEVKSLSSMQQAYVSSLDLVNYVNDELENFSKPSAPELKVADELDFENQIKISVLPSEKEALAVTGNSRYHLEMFKTCLNQLMQDYKVENNIFAINVVPAKDAPLPTLTPLEMYMNIVNGAVRTRYHYIGDFSPSGRIRPWGYMKEHLKRMDTVQKSLVFVARGSFSDLRDMACLTGVEAIIKRQYVGAESLKELSTIEKMGIRHDWVTKYSLLVKDIGSGKVSRSQSISILADILKACPEHYSARIYYEYLQGRLSPVLSLKNTYFEFEYFYNRMKEEGIGGYVSKEQLKKMGITDDKFIPEQLIQNSKALNAVMDDLKKLNKVAHRDFKSASEKLLEAYQVLDELNNKLIRSKSKWVSLNQKYFGLLREINLSRELFIDSQRAIDEVFQ